MAKPYIVRAYGEDDGETVATVPPRECSQNSYLLGKVRSGSVAAVDVAKENRNYRCRVLNLLPCRGLSVAD